MNSSTLPRTLVAGCALLLASCGGGGGGGGGPSTGYFKDASVIGMHYATATQSGETGSGGSFLYRPGETVTFSIGGLSLGSAAGSPVITPIDLVNGGTSSADAVLNRVRLLMALDDDGNPANGITIPTAVRAAAGAWTTPDFAVPQADFSTAMAGVLADANANGSASTTLPDGSVAQLQLEATVLCSYAGGFKGSYNGADTGKFGFMVDAQSGNIIGLARSSVDLTVRTVSGSVPMSYDTSRTFVSGAAGGATFTGSFPNANSVSGIWSGGGGTGTFSGQRLGGSATAQYRFTGTFGGGDDGLFTFDVNGGAVSGVGYSISGDNLLSISGTLSGTTLTATATSGHHAYAVNGTLDTGTGALSGNWNGNGKLGSFSGNGCRLN